MSKLTSIIFNQIDSFEDLGVVFTVRPFIPQPKRQVNVYNIPGRNGGLTELLGYEDITINIQMGFVDKENINNKIRMVKAWLCGEIKNNKLIFSDDSSFFYKVKHVSATEIDRHVKIWGTFTCTFVCSPFQYVEEGHSIITLNKPSSIFAPQYNYNSEPYIKIYATGDVTLRINNNSIQLKSIQDYIEIDTELMDCFKGKQPLNNKMVGEFPIFIAGENTITWTGNVTKIEITPNWRCL